MNKYILSLLLLSLPAARAEVNIGGLVDIVFKNSGEQDITNITFKGFSNFHSLRTRFFFDAQVDDKVSLFTQVLINDNTFSIYAAYARIQKIADNYLNLNIGFIPTPVGSFVSRTYSDKNPLLGQPLMYIHHSNYVPGRPDSLRAVDDLLANRIRRSQYGLPVIYDACWNSGVEFYGSAGKLDYSLGLIAGSVGYPNLEQKKDFPQLTTHLTWYFSPGLSIGGSAFVGPYLFEGGFADVLPVNSAGQAKSFNDYLNVGAAGEFHLATGYYEFYAEGVYNYWEHPYLPNLAILAGYLEAQYKFLPGWYIAARYDLWEPNKLADSLGEKIRWDYPVQRFEAGLGYHPYRRVTIKAVAQINRFSGTDLFDNELYALQLSFGF